MKLLQRKSKKKGFTLVELMVVIAIIAVLLLIAVPKLSESTKGAKVRTFEANFRTLMSATNGVYADSGLNKDKVVATNAVIADALANLAGKPNGATYKVDTAGKAVGELKIDGITSIYKVEFDVPTSKMTVTADAAWDDLRSFKSDTP